MATAVERSNARRTMAAAFPTELGWMAVVGEDRLLTRLAFGHPTSKAALHSAVNGTSADNGVEARYELLPPNPWMNRLVKRLKDYARGEIDPFLDIAVDLGGFTPFAVGVLEACRRIPFGETAGYGELAARVGAPRAARAVGNVMAANRVPLIVPCHRVLAAAGRLGNYSGVGGPSTKARLLALEAAALEKSA